MDSAKRRQAGREGALWIKLQPPAGQSCDGHRLEAVFEGVEYSTGVPCVCNQTTGGIRNVKLLE